MKTINKNQLLITAFFSFVMLICTDRLYAQDESQLGTQAGPYIFNGGLTAGYRNVTTDPYGGNPSSYWDQQRYYEAMNYRTGLVISSFNLFGERVGKGGFFDELYLNADGIGDPYTSASLRMREFNAYDLKLDYHYNRYYMNNDDSIYTGLHKYDEIRQTLNGSLAVDATDAIKLTALFSSTGHSGNFTTTVSPYVDGGDVLGGGIVTGHTGLQPDGNFGTYARGNFYWMNSPKNDQTNEYLLQGTFKLAPTTAMTVGGGFRSYDQTINFNPVNDTSLTYYSALGVPNAFSGIYGNFPNSPKAVSVGNNNPLISYSWIDEQKSSTPLFYLEGVTHPMNDLSITANLRYENTSTNGSTIKGNLLGIMPSAPSSIGGPKTTGQRIIADTTIGSSDNSLQSLLGSLTIAGKVNDQITLTGVYRYTNTNESSSGNIGANVGTNDTVTKTLFRSLYEANFNTAITNKVTQHYAEGFINYNPIAMMNIRAGVQYTARSPLFNRVQDGVSDSVANTNMSEETKGFTPFINFNYRVIPEFKFFGSYSHADLKAYFHGTSTQTDPMIRIVPEKTDKYSLGFETDPVKILHISFKYQGLNGSSNLLSMGTLVESFNPQLQTKMQSISGSLGLDVTKRTKLIFSADYRNSDFLIPVSYTRGQVDPFPQYGDSLTINDEQHTIDRSVDASLLVNEIDNLHIMVGYSTIVSTGGSIVSIDVKPGLGPDLVRMGGPYTWSLLHAQASYDITKNFSVLADYQLAMQKEDGDYPYTNVMNNYKASLVRGGITVRL